MSTPDIPTPDELSEIIATHRALFGGWRMMADENGDGTGDKQGEQEGQKQADDKDQSNGGDPAQGDTTDWKAEARKWEDRSKANKTAADQASQAQTTLLSKVLDALGIDKDGETKVDPDELAKQLAEQQAENRRLKLHDAIRRNAGDADPELLLDSNRFLDSIKDTDPADDKAIKDAITQAVKANTRLRRIGTTGGDTTADKKKPKVEISPGMGRLRAAYEANSTT